MRNGKNHLSKSDASDFIQRMRAIKESYDAQVGAVQFEELCDLLSERYPSWISELRKKREHYLFFLNYLASVGRTLCTTNVVEAVNGQLERMRANNGGYFHCLDTLKLKLGITLSHLEDGKWKMENTRF